jgi:hypothetical protein
VVWRGWLAWTAALLRYGLAAARLSSVGTCSGAPSHLALPCLSRAHHSGLRRIAQHSNLATYELARRRINAYASGGDACAVDERAADPLHGAGIYKDHGVSGAKGRDKRSAFNALALSPGPPAARAPGWPWSGRWSRRAAREQHVGRRDAPVSARKGSLLAPRSPCGSMRIQAGCARRGLGLRLTPELTSAGAKCRTAASLCCSPICYALTWA